MEESTATASNRTTDNNLRCPLCEYSLRGLIEPQCPECGHHSTWEELREQQPSHPYLFERHQQHNVWSFFRTLIGSFRPRKFWRELSPTLRPVPSRIFWFAAIVMLLSAIGGLGSVAMDLSSWAGSNAKIRQNLVQQWNLQSKPGPQYDPDIARTVTAITTSGQTINGYLHSQFPGLTDAAFWRNLFRRQSLSMFMLRSGQVGATAAAWPLLTFASLMIFRTSLRQARIQTVHVIRAVAYSGSILILTGPAMLLFAWLLPSLPFPTWTWWLIPFPNTSAIYFLMLMIVLLTYRLGVAYAKYLRFDRPYLTAIASQVIVLLTLWKIAFMAMGK